VTLIESVFIQLLCLTGFLCGWSDGLEFPAGQLAESNYWREQFQTVSEDVSVCIQRIRGFTTMSCINQLFTYLLILAVTVYCFDHSAVPMSSLVVSVVSAIIRFFMKLFYTSNTITVKECQMFFFLF